MSRVVERTAVHPLFQELHDYSTGLSYFDGSDGLLVARETAIPAHIFGTLVSVEALVAEFGSDLHDGDVLMLNDPYYGGSHQADFTMMEVVELSSSEFLFSSTRAHQSDFGGVVPGGYNPDAREIWQEGYRIPPIRLVAGGVFREDLWDVIVANSRLTETLRGDLLAMLSGCRVGAREARRLVGKYGSGAVSESIWFYMEYAAERFRAEVERWPDGVYVGERLLDHDSVGNHDIRVRAEVEISGDRLSIDLRGSDPESPGYVNSVPGTTISNAMLALCVVLPEDIPYNSGVLCQIEVKTLKGSCVDPLPPAPHMSSTTTVGYEVADAVMLAMQQVVPERVGEPGLGYCLCTTFGKDSRFDDELYYTLDFGSSMVSAGGAFGVDGWGAWPTSVSALILANVELLELQYPFLFEVYEYADDSCAAGQWRGVSSFIMKRRTLGEHPSYVTLTQESYRNTLPGFVGGEDGASSYAILKPGEPDELFVTESIREYPLQPGEVLYTYKGGGGGWGHPYDRDPDAVLEDLLDDLVSPQTAYDTYGVILTDTNGTYTIDHTATKHHRTQTRNERTP